MPGTPDPRPDDPVRLERQRREEERERRSQPAARTSGLLAVLGTLVGVALLAAGTGQVAAVGTAVVAGLVFAGVTTLAARRTPLGDLLATLVLPVLAVLFLAAVALPAVRGGALPVVLMGALTALAVVFAVFGAATAPTGGLGNGSVFRTASLLFETLSLPVLATGVLFLTDLALLDQVVGVANDVTGDGVDALLSPGQASPEVAGFTLLVSVASMATAAALARLPLAQFVDREDRQQVSEVLARVAGRLRTVGVLAMLAFPVLLVVQVVAGVAPMLSWSPAVLELVRAVTTAQPLRLVLFGVAVLATALVLVVGLVTRLARRNLRETAGAVAPRLAGGAVVTGLVLAMGEQAFSLVLAEVPSAVTGVLTAGADAASPTVVVLALVVALAAGFLGVLLGFSMVAGMGFVSDRTASASVAGGGLVAAALFAGIGGVPPLVLFGTVATGLVVWDVASYGTVLGAELGDDAATHRPELVHAVAGGFVGVAAVVPLAVLAGQRIPVGGSTAAVVGVVAAVGGVVALVAALRG
ncbi:DUF7519 family protein [Haloarchaeobius amylolyticus]|uniref:DUF7519 family protein n=1 Tax=Haloarchaeobius amylolyticus TaxID=1198296 RepID=UPI00227020AC|nr:hypothetical protein [Haloarchaeobius amylolyticus]